MDDVLRQQVVPTKATSSAPGNTERSFPGVAVLLAIAACMLLSSALAQDTDADRFYERWLRAFGVQSVDDIPRFAGPVAEVTRTTETDGKVSERRVWRFDEGGLLTDTELTVYAGNREVTYMTTWHYGTDGLPFSLDLMGTTSDVLFFTWSENAVEMASSLNASRFTYDAQNDVITVEQTLPNEVRRTFDFEDDGSHAILFETRDEEGKWRETLNARADEHNVRTFIQSAVVTTDVEILERDEHGNPTQAARSRTGNVNATDTVRWEVIYR